MSPALYTALVAGVSLERVLELRLSLRNAAWSLKQGGVEHGEGHYPAMVVLHTALLLGCVAEVWLLDRPWLPTLGVSMLVLALACQGLRWWVISTLGPRWNTRVIVIPGLAPVREGPFRWLRHPNYLAVVLEGIALPLIHTAWLTALLFTVLNLFLLATRIRCEEASLRWAKNAIAVNSALPPENPTP